MYNRLKLIREKLGLSQKDFADEIGIGTSSLGMMEVGKREIKKRHIKIICSMYNINEQWLSTGEGEMFNPQTELFEQLKSKYNLSPTDINIVQNYLKLDSQDRDLFISYLSKIVTGKNED